ncbi:alanine--tRNA ligase [bacterium K02(2017)]|nr:alanine--tRNA ligase [bacterium K02(2017)]
MTLSGNEIRQKFLSYYASKGHEIVKSSNLVPQNDPTLYFVNAGMVPFKNFFTGAETAPYKTATSSQKCMRVSGKHNDLENVGRTARHHTFFEMLGNFSFGNYFKTDAIKLAWDFLTKELKLPIDKLWISIFEEDDEAGKIWSETTDIPAERIVKMGEKDNYWSMGETGPCGPCSEIYYDQEIPCSLNNPKCAFGTCECDRYIEIWNLVFMQFERHADKSQTPLPKPSIDTGMGLERLTSILQGKKSNYDSDLFTPILKDIQKVIQKKYGANAEDDTSMRVLADHIRSTVFLINDGVLPSNEGRGYVLRRIMRRAIRHGKLLGQSKAFFYRLVKGLVSEMDQAYPELKTNQITIEKVILAEEERFFDTLDKGLKLLSTEIDNHKNNKLDTLSGEVAFKLYDTFGFPLDLTELIAAENNLKLNQADFDVCMNQQKERARAGWKGSGEAKTNVIYFDLAEKHHTNFTGYTELNTTSKVLGLIQNGVITTEVNENEFEFFTETTPFYAESGGQVSDKGIIKSKNFEAIITDVQKPKANFIIHHAKVKKGTLKTGDTIQLQVNPVSRQPIQCNHTATHIMHAALRKILGSHVRQAGSYVDDKILRFDFSHFEAIPKETLAEIETAVNKIVLANISIQKNEMDYDKAIEKGALAFFGDKYTDKVRVISIGDYSTELCGGTHLNSTSEIGFFKILSESSIAAGVRRIEAITGPEAIKHSQLQSSIVQKLTQQLKTQSNELPDKIESLTNKIKTLEKEVSKYKTQLMQMGSADLLKDSFEINGIKMVIHHTEDAKSVRELAKTLQDKIKSGVAIITSNANNKALVVVTVTKDLTKQYPANIILQPLAEMINGRGGGKADMAQAGGTEIAGLKGIKDKLVEVMNQQK